jgi:hypothetical protein
VLPGDPPASGLSIDDEGRFLVAGEPVTHARTLEVLWQGLSRRPDGRWQVRIGRELALVEVRETAWLVRAVEEREGRLEALLVGGGCAPLDPATLRVGPDGVLRVTLPTGDPARFTRAAQVALGLQLAEDPSAPGGFRLDVGGRSFPLGRE